MRFRSRLRKSLKARESVFHNRAHKRQRVSDLGENYMWVILAACCKKNVKIAVVISSSRRRRDVGQIGDKWAIEKNRMELEEGIIKKYEKAPGTQIRQALPGLPYSRTAILLRFLTFAVHGAASSPENGPPTQSACSWELDSCSSTSTHLLSSTGQKKKVATRVAPWKEIARSAEG